LSGAAGRVCPTSVRSVTRCAGARERGVPGPLAIGTQRFATVALSDRPLEERVQAPVAVVGGRRLPAGQLVGDEPLEALWALADATEVEILNLLDDHSRVCVGSHARRVFTAHDVDDCFATPPPTTGIRPPCSATTARCSPAAPAAGAA
jgi:hypothetical protein